ncbi:MAG TPA: hypothetical protein VM345_05800 [Acidimicrobiales bacterium]|jgi:hypothetical protein|nr:hypothetical protein [Acidimicrobiales bacterium]
MPNNFTVDAINASLSTQSVRSLQADGGEFIEQLGQPGSFLEVARSLGLDERDLEYLQSVPEVLQETIRATVAAAVSSGKAVQVQYSPAYDFEVRVWDYGAAVSLHLSGPYPPDFARERYLAEAAGSE